MSQERKLTEISCRRISASRAISTAATTTVTCTTIQPAVTKGRPKTRVPSWPFVWMALSKRWDSLCRSAKSWMECRDRKKEMTNKTPPSTAKSSPTTEQVD